MVAVNMDLFFFITITNLPVYVYVLPLVRIISPSQKGRLSCVIIIFITESRLVVWFISVLVLLSTDDLDVSEHKITKTLSSPLIVLL